MNAALGLSHFSQVPHTGKHLTARLPNPFNRG